MHVGTEDGRYRYNSVKSLLGKQLYAVYSQEDNVQKDVLVISCMYLETLRNLAEEVKFQNGGEQQQRVHGDGQNHLKEKQLKESGLDQGTERDEEIPKRKDEGGGIQKNLDPDGQ